MFVEDQELLKIVVYYKKEGRHYIAYGEKDFNKTVLQEDQDKYDQLKIDAKPLTWGLYNDLQESAMIPDELGNRRWNYKVYKENKLRKIISSWDAQMTKEDGSKVKAPVNPQVIGKMAPEIAEVILNTYDQMTLIDEEEEKKS